jgi:hypothetical protein
MRNFGEMTEDVLAHLRSYVRDQEMSTHLTADIGFADTLIAVHDAAVITRGRIEIDDELLWVDSADRGNSLVTLPPYGRGMDGTNKAAHAAGTRVIIQPLYPRKTVKDTMNQVITAVGQKLYGVEVLTLRAHTRSFMYEMPSDARDALAVKVSDRRAGLIGEDVRWLRGWTFDKHAPANVSSTGKALYVTECAIGPTEELTVTISRDPMRLMFDTQMFEESFLPATAWDVVVLMAASRLLATADAYNVVGRSVEANTLDSKVQPGQGVAQSKYLYQLATARLEEERSRLLSTTMHRAHYSR